MHIVYLHRDGTARALDGFLVVTDHVGTILHSDDTGDWDEPPRDPSCPACESGDCLTHTGRSPFRHPMNHDAVLGSRPLRYLDKTWHYYALYRVPLTTICFMNCKNVKVNWLPPPDKAYIKSFARKHDGKRPSTHVGTINITPMTRLISAAVYANKDPSKSPREIAASICRGHFKTYTNDHPLFGKIVGTFWWNCQRVGSNRQTPKNQNRKSTPSTLKASL